MAISDNVWTIGWSVWAFAPSIGATMLTSSPALKTPAKLLFWASPIGPLVADLIWIWTNHPSYGEIIIVSMVVGSVVSMTLTELLRWHESKADEERHLG